MFAAFAAGGTERTASATDPTNRRTARSAVVHVGRRDELVRAGDGVTTDTAFHKERVSSLTGATGHEN
jgi:hypothetical protein